MITVGARVQIADPGDPYHGWYGTVTQGEYLSTLTRRPMIDVRIDGQAEWHDHGFYTAQVEEIRLQVVA